MVQRVPPGSPDETRCWRRGALLGHLARTNDQWQLPVQGEDLVTLRGPDAYVRPQAYASTVEHGRVVPTWNSVPAHVHRIHRPRRPALTRMLDRLTRHHAAAAPRRALAGQRPTAAPDLDRACALAGPGSGRS